MNFTPSAHAHRPSAPLGALFMEGQSFSRAAFSSFVRHETSQGSHDAVVSLSLFAPDGRHTGAIQLSSLSDESAANVLEWLIMRQPTVSPDGTVANVQSLSAESLQDFLEYAASQRATIRSTLGGTIAEIATAHGERAKPAARVAHISRLEKQFAAEISSDEAKTSPLRWIKVDNADEEYLTVLAKEFGIRQSLLRACHKNDDHASVFRRGDHLFICVRELVVAPPESKNSSVISVKSVDVNVVLGPGLLITLASGPSRVVDRVWQEAQRDELDLDERSSSNHLASRIIGCATHYNASSIATLREQLTDFVMKTGGRAPTEGEIDLLRQIRYINADVVDPTLSGVSEIVAALKEPANYYGAKGPSEKLERFSNIVEGNHRALDRIEAKIEATDDAWRNTLVARSSENLNRVTVLAGVLAVPATVFGFFGMEWNANLPDIARWMGTYTALGLSALLLARGAIKNGLGWLWGAGDKPQRTS